MADRIALIDDDDNIRASVSEALMLEGFAVECHDNGLDGLNAVTAQPPALVVLDIKMPKMDGMAVLEKIREKSLLPVIMLTSKDEESSELTGLMKGADDYIKKPFSIGLLVARIKAVLKRSAAKHGSATDNVLERGFLKLDRDSHACFWKGGEITLTITEFLILLSLVERPGHIKTRDQLIDFAYGSSYNSDDRMIDTHIKRLRKKFKEADDAFNHIETIYGLGYKYKE